jgi:hypothetical protein
MESTLKILVAHQLSSGQFLTTVINEREGFIGSVHTITPTYLICLMLDEIREHRYSHPLLDSIIQKSVEFLARMCYTDPITGLRVWHFNAFYAPDWEETAWNAYLLHKFGLLTQKELEPLRKLALANETHDQGIGVWLRDTYSTGNRYNNVFDPVVALSVSQFLYRVFGERSESTERYISRAIESKGDSLYYDNGFRNFFLYLLGRGSKPNNLEHDSCRLFHHGNRTNIWYGSRDVWETAELVMAA